MKILIIYIAQIEVNICPPTSSSFGYGDIGTGTTCSDYFFFTYVALTFSDVNKFFYSKVETLVITMAYKYQPIKVKYNNKIYLVYLVFFSSIKNLK